MRAITEKQGDVTEIYHKDPHDDKFHVEIVQDVSQYLKANKEDRDHSGTKFSNKSAFHKVASIPEVVVAQWWKELGSNPLSVENRKWLIAKLNSSDYPKLKTKDVTI